MDLIVGTGDGCAGTALRVFSKGVENGAKVLGSEIDLEGEGCLPVIFDDGRKSLNDSFCLRFPVPDLLLDIGGRRKLRVHLKEGAGGA